MKQQSSLKLRLENLLEFEPQTKNQAIAFSAYEKGQSLVLAGAAGTGKTFSAMYMALEDVLDKETHYDKVIVIRSIVPTRDIGFLPGDEDEKKLVYEAPYRGICQTLFNMSDAWDKLKAAGHVQFMSTSFIRGITIDNAVIIVDEMQNMSFHELDSIITRVGENCRIIIAGDYYQSDLQREKERDGILKFLEIVERLKYFTIVEFNWEDIVRSGMVRDYLMTKEMLEIR